MTELQKSFYLDYNSDFPGMKKKVCLGDDTGPIKCIKCFQNFQIINNTPNIFLLEVDDGFY